MAGKLGRAGDLLDGLDRSLRQHIVDEEAQVLKRLISARGRDGADSDIKTMQQHRRIHRQIQAVQERLPSWSDPDVSVYVELDRLVRDHLKKEELDVYPRALGKRLDPYLLSRDDVERRPEDHGGYGGRSLRRDRRALRQTIEVKDPRSVDRRKRGKGRPLHRGPHV